MDIEVPSLSMFLGYTKAIIRPTPEYLSLFYGYLTRSAPTERLETDQATNGFWNLLYYYFKFPIEIIPNLYLGNIINASNYEQLEELKIDTVFNVTEEHGCYFPDYFDYHRVIITDVKDAVLDDTFYEAVTKLKTALDSNKRVLVHCHHGRSRSVSLIIAYLLTHHSQTYNNFQEAYAMLKEKKPIINLNTDFANQLLEKFNQDLQSETS